jgi:hypothetical protein
MAIDAAKIAQMEEDLEQARAELQRQNGVKFDILWAWLSDADKERFHDSLTRKPDRVLFGLEAPDRTGRPGKSGGDLSCPLCDKKGLTKRGLALHTVRMHRGVNVEEALPPQEKVEGVSRRARQGRGDTSESTGH